MKYLFNKHTGLLLLPLMVVIGNYAGGWWNYLCFFSGYFLLPVFEHLNPAKKKKQEEQVYSEEREPGILLFVPVLLFITLFFIYRVSQNKYEPYEFVGLFLSVGYVNGAIGFTLAHEFIHRHLLKERVAAYTLLFITNYLHYGTEHLYGHHVYACTGKDPHTARRGESFYFFLPRAIAATWKNAFDLYRDKIRKKRKKSSAFHNIITWYGLMHTAFIIVLWITLGPAAAVFFVCQGIIAVTLLHHINYLQHYGLERKLLPGGKFEKIGAQHAWRTAYQCRAINLFNLDHHAHHHIHPALSYQKLKVEAASPELPGNYAGMMLLSLVPPLWFHIIHKRILHHP